MRCETCGKEHTGDYGSGRFCSRACANTRKPSEKTKQSISLKLKVHPDKFCKACGKQLTGQRNTTGLCKSCLGLERRGSGKYKTSSEIWGPYIKARRAQFKLSCIAILGSKCLKCGYEKYVGALEFHHIDPSQKKFGLTGNGFSRAEADVIAEVRKCVLLCSNCHKELHEDLRQGITLEEFLKDN